MEGAVTLINKIGYIIDEKLEGTEKGKKKNLKVKSEYMKIYERLEDLASEENIEVSKRVKLLIKNMFDHRKSGWLKAKSKSEQGPMKLQELKKIEDEKARLAEE